MSDLDKNDLDQTTTVADVTTIKGLTQYTSASVNEIEHHLHSRSYVFPESCIYAVTCSSHGTADTFGTWQWVASGSTFTASYGKAPHAFDPHQITYQGATTNKNFYVQLGYGDGVTASTAVLGTDVFNSAAATRHGFDNFQTEPIDYVSSHSLYARCKDDNGGSSIAVRVGVHFYDT
jgi:hypothetical protein